MAVLDTDTITQALEELPGWQLEGDAIRREFTFDDFLAAVDFINRLAPLAEEANHHPELTNVYATVAVVLTTHDEGGVTTKDLDLARAIDGVA